MPHVKEHGALPTPDVDLVVVLERRLWITRVSGAKKKKCEYIFREITISMQNHIFCTHTDYTLHYGLFGN